MKYLVANEVNVSNARKLMSNLKKLGPVAQIIHDQIQMFQVAATSAKAGNTQLMPAEDQINEIEASFEKLEDLYDDITSDKKSVVKNLRKAYHNA